MEGAASDGVLGNRFGRENVFYAAPFFACRYFRVWSMAVNEHVNEMVSEEKCAEFSIIMAIAQPRVKVAGNDDIIVGLLCQEDR